MIGSVATSEFTPQVDIDPKDRPLILIAPRIEEAGEYNGEALSPWEEIAKCFVDAIVAAGGLPLQMALDCPDCVIERYVEVADGIAIPGGADVNPACWGDPEPYDPALCCDVRDTFELKLVEYALKAQKPLFATCRGAQLLNVACGGTLCMDVPGLGACEGMTQWKHDGVITKPVHPVTVEKDSLLSRVLDGATIIQTNSAHHCCVSTTGPDVRVTAHATDGVPEAIEVAGQPFALGVQWHPEYTWQTIESDFKLWAAFVDAAREGRASR